MQITKKRLKQIIKEEMNSIQSENISRDDMRFLTQLSPDQMEVLLAVLEDQAQIENLISILRNKLGMSGMLGGAYTGGSRINQGFED